jgi:ketosteroid isomerase-like protein/Tfp pilus assembly protein PilF
MNNTTHYLLLALFLVTAGLLRGQDFFMPVSSDSPKAVAAYQKASQLGSNVRMSLAREEIERALEADPDFFMAHAYLIQVLSSNEEKPELIDRALAIDTPDFTKAEKIMRRYLEDLKEDPKAMPTKMTKALVKAYPRTPEAYEWAYLHAAYTEKNLDAAFKYARQMVDLKPDYAPVHNNLGYFHLQREEMEQAKASFEKYIALAPEEANAYDSMGEFYMINGDYVASAKYYREADGRGMPGAAEKAQKATASMNEAAPGQQNTAVVQSIYDDFSEGDIPAVLNALHKEVVWNEAEGNDLADGNPYVGPDAVLQGVFARLGEQYEYFRLKDIELHPMIGNEVLATLRYDAKLKENGMAIDAQAAHLWTVENGKVTAFQQYVDTRQLAEKAAKK